MKNFALRYCIVVVLAATANQIPAQVVQNPVGTPNVGGCQPPRQWTMRDGWYQCLMPPVAPGGGSPGGGALTTSDLARMCSRYAVSKGYNLSPANEDPRRHGDDDIFIAQDLTPGGSFTVGSAVGPAKDNWWSLCQTNGRPDAVTQCWITSTGTIVDFKASYSTCAGG